MKILGMSILLLILVACEGYNGAMGPQGPQGIPGVSVGTTSPSLSDFYVGCYVDKSTRSLSTELISSDATLATCAEAAQTNGYRLFSLEYGGQCFAGNALKYALASESKCNMPCHANSTELCGGTWYMSVYMF